MVKNYEKTTWTEEIFKPTLLDIDSEYIIPVFPKSVIVDESLTDAIRAGITIWEEEYPKLAGTQTDDDLFVHKNFNKPQGFEAKFYKPTFFQKHSRSTLLVLFIGLLVSVVFLIVGITLSFYYILTKSPLSTLIDKTNSLYSLDGSIVQPYPKIINQTVLLTNSS